MPVGGYRGRFKTIGNKKCEESGIVQYELVPARDTRID
jgi:hypothetical protein